MTTFDQHGQSVRYQYNAAGDINFGVVRTRPEVAAELQKLQAEVGKAAQAGALDQDKAVDVEAKLKKAILQAQKPEPDKKTTLDYLSEARALIEGIASAAGLVTGLTQAAALVGKLFL